MSRREWLGYLWVITTAVVIYYGAACAVTR